MIINKNIFRKYDIRGIYEKDLYPDLTYLIGFHFGSMLKGGNNKNLTNICIGYDGRLSSVEMFNDIARGIIDCGLNVINIGLCHTPLLYYAARKFNNSAAIMITGSHNPKEYNGMKIVKDGKPFYDLDLQKLYSRISTNKTEVSEIRGSITAVKLQDEYLCDVFKNMYISENLKIVFDSANGATGDVVDKIKQEYISNSVTTFTNVDGHFPNHHPDPSDARNLIALKENVLQVKADIGIMFDGDGDRVGFVDENGKELSNDEMIYIFSEDVLNRIGNCGKIILDIKCSHYLINAITKIGGTVEISQTGHPYVKEKMQNTAALFGAELSGHVCFKDSYFGFDDGVYAAIRMLNILSKHKIKLSELRKRCPMVYGGKEIKIDYEDDVKFAIIEKIKNHLKNTGIVFLDIDGVKIIEDSGSILIRASNTTPNLILICNSNDIEQLQVLENRGRDIITRSQRD